MSALFFVLGLTHAPRAYADASSGASLDIFHRARVDVVLEMRPAQAREAIVEQFQKVRMKYGSLDPLSRYLESRNDLLLAKSLLALTHAENKQYAAAIEVLETLNQVPNPEPWVAVELARVRQLLDSQRTWDQLSGVEEDLVLSREEQARIDEIAGLAPDKARTAMASEIRALLSRYGDLQPVLGYLGERPASTQTQAMLAIAAAANGDLRLAERALAAIAEEPIEDPWVIAELGRLKEMRGVTKEAVSHFQHAMALSDDPAVQFALTLRVAQLEYENGNRDAARKALRDLVTSGPAATVQGRNYAARIAGLQDDLPLVAELFQPVGQGKALLHDLFYFGDILLRLGEPERAREQYAAALRLTKQPRDRRYALDRLVASARAMDGLPALIDQWLALETITPEHVDIMTGILSGELDRVGDLFLLVGRDDLPETTRKYIESPGFQERFAALASEAQRPEAAAAAFRDLIKRYPEEPAYRDGYARLLLMLGDRDAAEKVYRSAIEDARSADGFLAIASGARRCGLKAIALDAVDAAHAIDGTAGLKAALFKSSLLREQGENDAALDLLRATEGAVGEDASDLVALSAAYERLGYTDDAIRLCKRATALTDSERQLRKLIALLEANGRSDEAYLLWRRLWETANEPMTIIQANDRLLDLGSREGRLADLAIEFEDRLADGGLRDLEMTLLLDIYTSVGDPVSAADVLMEVAASDAGNTVKTQERLLRVYMETELFGRAQTVLNKLIEMDPDNRDEHLQMLAVVALERGNPGDALVVLEQLGARSEDGVLRDSFSASVLNMLGKPATAARAYRRALTDNPNEIESWLLWGNALAARDAQERQALLDAGERLPAPREQRGSRQVRGVLSMMLEQTQDDDLFVISIDGLLNARAPKHALQNSLRRLHERIASDPHNLLLYRLAADLNEEIERPLRVVGVLEQAIAIADDSRGILLRELGGMARTAGRGDKVIEHGRSILNITEHLPPSECLALGSMLLQQGRVAEADAAFQRVILDQNALGAARDVALQYENAGLFAKAGKVLRILLVSSPYDIELYLRLGLLEEKRANASSANRAYLRALDLMMAGLPREGGRQINRGRNISDIQRYFDLVVRGLIASAQTPEAQQDLLASIKRRIDTELTQINERNAHADRLAGNPRLEKLATLARRIGLINHQPQMVELIDAELQRRYPEDNGFAGQVQAARQAWLLHQEAGRFRPDQAPDNNSAEDFALNTRLMIEPWARDASPAKRADAILLGTLFGHDDLASKALDGLNLEQTPKSDGETLVVAGLAQNNPEMIRSALFTNLNRIRRELEPLKGLDRSRQHLKPTTVYRQIIAAWPVLNEQDRSTAASLYGMLLEKEHAMFTLEGSWPFLLSLAGRSDEIEIDHLRHFLSRHHFFFKGHLSVIFSRWLGDMPANQRLEAVQELIADRKDDQRGKALSTLSALLDPGVVTPELKAAYPESFAPARRADEVLRTDFAAERERYAKQIAHTLRTIGNDGGHLFALHDLTLRPAANKLPAEEFDRLVEPYLESADPFERLVAFLLLRHAGREIEALHLLHALTSLPQGNARSDAVRSALPSFLQFYGWDVYAWRAIQREAPDAKPDLMLATRLNDPLAILDQQDGSLLKVGTRRIYAATLMPSQVQLTQALRIYQAQTRHPDLATRRTSITAQIWPDRLVVPAGGMRDVSSRGEASIIDQLASIDGGQAELMHWMRTLSPSNFSDERQIARQIAESARVHGLVPSLRTTIDDAADQGSLNHFDLELIDALALIAPDELPISVADHLDKIVLRDWRGDASLDPRWVKSRKGMGLYVDPAERLAALGGAAQRLGRDELSAALYRWSVAVDVMATGAPKHLGAYLRSLPQADRKTTLEEMLPILGLSDARPFAGEGLRDLLNVLMDYGLTSKASNTADHYLSLRLASRSIAQSFSSIGTMIEGVDGDLSEMDDAVAVVLARLGRAEAYERLLLHKNRSLAVRRSALNRSASSASMPMMDHTAAMPEPDQIDDIQRFIDIQRRLPRILRAEGVLDAESHVAQLCLLGRWCAQRGLTESAQALLTEATERSAEMLRGRLWVVDLHRALDQDETADAIELELLEHDLLPMPRVPHALHIMARQQSDAAANSVAYRLAVCSNHAEVLKRALQYARDEGFRADYLDLANRFRLVSTTFLPPGSPFPIKGYDSLAAWSASITRTASKMPLTPDPRPLVALKDEQHPSIARVIVKGEQPEMIYVPIIHDQTFSHLASNDLSGVRAIMSRCEDIADRLYHRYGVRNILLEGISNSFVEQYNRIPLQRRTLSGSGDGNTMIVHRTWSRLLAEKEWVMRPASDRPLVGPLNSLGTQTDAKIVAALNNAKKSGWFRSREAFEEHRATLQNQLDAIAGEYNAKRKTILEEDPDMKREHGVIVAKRNKAFLDSILASDQPGVVFFGAGHWQDLNAQLNERGVSYAVVVPKGVAWPPKQMDDEKIKNDMLSLGAQLRKSTLTLGDGTVSEILIPLD